MTSNHKGRRAETVRLQNVSTTNPAQLWLADAELHGGDAGALGAAE